MLLTLSFFHFWNKKAPNLRAFVSILFRIKPKDSFYTIGGQRDECRRECSPFDFVVHTEWSSSFPCYLYMCSRKLLSFVYQTLSSIHRENVWANECGYKCKRMVCSEYEQQNNRHLHVKMGEILKAFHPLARTPSRIVLFQC